MNSGLIHPVRPRKTELDRPLTPGLAHRKPSLHASYTPRQRTQAQVHTPLARNLCLKPAHTRPSPCTSQSCAPLAPPLTHQYDPVLPGPLATPHAYLHPGSIPAGCLHTKSDHRMCTASVWPAPRSGTHHTKPTRPGATPHSYPRLSATNPSAQPTPRITTPARSL